MLFWPLMTLIRPGQCLSAHQISRKYRSKVAAAYILNFPKNAILDRLCSLYCLYLSAYQTWCKAVKNWPRYTVLCFLHDGRRRHLEFVILPFSITTMSSLVDFMFANGVMISLSSTERRLLQPNFWGLPLNCGAIILTSKECSFRGTSCFDTLRVKIGSAISAAIK